VGQRGHSKCSVLMLWAGHVARIDEERGCSGSWLRNRKEGTT